MGRSLEIASVVVVVGREVVDVIGVGAVVVAKGVAQDSDA